MINIDDNELQTALGKFTHHQMKGEGIAALLRTAREDALGDIGLSEEHLNGIGTAINDVLSDMFEQFEIMANRYEVLLNDAGTHKPEEGEQ